MCSLAGIWSVFKARGGRYRGIGNRRATPKDRPNPPSPWGRGGTRLSAVLLLGHRFPICSLVAPSCRGGWRSRRAYVHLSNEVQSSRSLRRFVTPPSSERSEENLCIIRARLKKCRTHDRAHFGQRVSRWAQPAGVSWSAVPMLRSSLHKVHGMGKKVHDRLQGFGGSLRTSREAQDQGLIAGTCQGSREGCKRGGLQALHAHQLGQSGDFLVQQGGNCLGSYIAGAESGFPRW